MPDAGSTEDQRVVVFAPSGKTAVLSGRVMWSEATPNRMPPGKHIHIRREDGRRVLMEVIK